MSNSCQTFKNGKINYKLNHKITNEFFWLNSSISKKVSIYFKTTSKTGEK